MIRSKAKQITIIFIGHMNIIFLITAVENAGYSKSLHTSQSLLTVLSIINEASFIWMLVAVLFLFLLFRGKFHFEDDNMFDRQPKQQDNQPKRGLFNLGSAFGGKQAQQSYAKRGGGVLYGSCANCGHSLTNFNRHVDSFTDLRSNVEYCTTKINGQVCGCEKPELAKALQCPNCGHQLDQTKTEHMATFTDLRSNVAYCKALAPNGQICGCDDIAPQERRPMPMQQRPASQQPPANTIPQQIKYGEKPITLAGKPSKMQSAHNDMVTKLTDDLIGESSRGESWDTTDIIELSQAKGNRSNVRQRRQSAVQGEVEMAMGDQEPMVVIKPKPRGRPRKAEIMPQEFTKPVEQAQAKRGRGRPPKPKSVEQNEVNYPSPKGRSSRRGDIMGQEDSSGAQMVGL